MKTIGNDEESLSISDRIDSMERSLFNINAVIEKLKELMELGNEEN